MAKSFLTDLNLNNNVLLNAKIQAWGSAPTGTTNPNGSGSAVAGQISTYNGALYIFSGSAWNAVAGGSVTIGSTSVAVNGSAVTTFTGLSSVTSTTFVGALTGNASTATALQTARAINGVNFDGSAAITIKASTTYALGLTNSNLAFSSGTTWDGGTTGITLGLSATPTSLTSINGITIASSGAGSTGTFLTSTSTASALTSVGTLTSLTMGGTLAMGTNNITGTGSISATTFTGALTGNASTATTLQTARNINGVSFNGSADITVTAAAGTLSGSTLNSGVTASSLTSVGTLTSLTMGGNIAMANNKITGLADPSSASDAATKNYVDNVAQGVNAHDAVRALISGTIAGVYSGTTLTANPPGDGGYGLNATITYSATGTTTVDTTVTLAQGDRVLVTGGVTADSGTTSKTNGIYVVTTAGTSGVATVLTRAIDYDNSVFGDITAGDLIYVTSGSTYGGTQWVQTTKGTATTGTGASTRYCVLIGTDSITFTQFSGNGAVPFATTTTAGIASFPSAQFSVSTGAVSVTNLAGSVVTSGLVSPTYGGTGINNGSKTITLSGNATIGSNTDTVQFTTAGNTNVTLPTSGTLVNSAVTTLSSLASVGTITVGTWNGTLISPTYGGTGVNNGSSTITIGGNMSFSGAYTTAFTVTGATSLTLPTSGTLTTTTGTAGSISAASVSTSTGTAVSVVAGATTNATGTGGAVTVTGGAATTGTGLAFGGSVTIAGGDSNTTKGTGGAVYIRGGNGDATTVNGSKGNVYIGDSNTALVQIGVSGTTTPVTIPSGSITMAGIAPSSNNFLRIAATTGTVTSGFILYGDLPTTSLAAVTTSGIARKATGAGTGTGTSISVTHGFGQWVHAQLFDSSGNLVEVDIQNTATSNGTTIFTFASSQTLTGFQYVIIG